MVDVTSEVLRKVNLCWKWSHALCKNFIDVSSVLADSKNMKKAGSSELSVNTYRTRRSHILDDRKFFFNSGRSFLIPHKPICCVHILLEAGNPESTDGRKDAGVKPFV
jgi:hypothetical protein